jgi:hypothetical protein
MTSILRAPRLAALIAIAVLVASASAVSFAESYRGLYLWAAEHGLHGPWAAIWPLQVDVFIAVGELALFVALADRWAPRSRAAAWAVTLAGLAVSVAGNVGHVGGRSLATHATAAIPPLAAAAALAVGLGVLKRVVERHHQAPELPRTPPVSVPSLRQIQAELRVGQDKARQVQRLVRASANGHQPSDPASDAPAITAGRRAPASRRVTRSEVTDGR